MGKVYSIESYRLKREIKDLEEKLSKRIQYCEKNGYMWLDHYTIKDMHECINDLYDRLKRIDDERPA